MILLDFLVGLSPVVTITANVSVLFYVTPAFKRTRNLAFLFLGCAALLGTFDTVCDHTVGLDSYRHGGSGYVAYRSLRRLTYIADCVLGAAGIVLLAQAALKEPQANRSKDDESS